jgi:integrase
MAKQKRPGSQLGQEPKPERRKFPVEIWAGGSLVRIFHDPLLIPVKPLVGQKVNPSAKPRKKKYDSYLVEHYVGSERVRDRRSSFEKARALADGIKIKLLNNQVDSTRLVGRDQQIYMAAAAHLQSVVEAPLDQAAKDYVEAVKMFRVHGLTFQGAVHELDSALKRLNGTPLSTAVHFFELHRSEIKAEKTVSEVFDEMLKAKREDNVGHYHIRDLELRCGFFAKAFPGKILEVTTPQIDAWLRGLKSRSRQHKGAALNGITRNNYRDSVVELFNYARKAHYLLDKSTAADDSKAVKAITAENEILTPEEVQRLLAGAPEHMIPGMAIKAFSGVRTEEVIVLEWSAVKFEQDCIILPKGMTKLDQRRVIPLKPNLKAWLLPYRKDEGRLCERWTLPNSVAHAWKRWGNLVKVNVGKNKFRNSYISYRVAETMDPKTVAFESGNSERTIRRDYLEVTTAAEASKWFSIFPPQALGGKPELKPQAAP